MIPVGSATRDKRQQRLLGAFDKLDDAARESVIAFAEFLRQRPGDAEHSPLDTPKPEEPKDLPRPPSESVIAAVRRLSDTYYMIDKSILLHETSGLVSAHVMQGRTAEEVVKELESLFEAKYREYRDGFEE